MNTSASVAAATIAVCAAVLSGCGATEADASPNRGREADAARLAAQAEQYVGDPWEKRFRAQFWNRQHLHDSWNRCHLGENAPRPRGCDGSSLTPRG